MYAIVRPVAEAFGPNGARAGRPARDLPAVCKHVSWMRYFDLLDV